jgi:hypothetical protein
MSDGTPASNLNELISSGPEEVRIWLAALRAGTIDPKQWNLLYLRSYLSNKAVQELSLEWLAVAIEFLEYIAESIGGKEGEDHLMRAMSVRAHFISHMGVHASQELLQLEPIAEWFLANLPLTLEEAATKSARWTELPIEEIRVLRLMKNRLRVFLPLANGALLDAYPAIKAWLTIRSKLP